jgi:putative flippase GtrA
MRSVQRLTQLLRGAGIGVLATIVDLAVLLLLVEGAGISPLVANIPALLVGAAVQFVGCRHVVFRSREAKLGQQIVGFAVTEAATLALNGLAFHVLLTLTPVPYPFARPIGTFLVFVLFSFPMWRLVFRQR